MRIHEYQAREILRGAGVLLPPSVLVGSGAEAEKAFLRLNVPEVVVKAQVLAGGRGKAGGIKLVRSAAEAAAQAERMLARPLVTPQTGPAGEAVREVLIVAAVDMVRSFYVGLVVDRALGLPVMMASAQGGVDIEETAARSPAAIRREACHPLVGLMPYQARNLAAMSGLAGRAQTEAAALMTALARLFIEMDCTLIEVNPLALARDGRVVPVDVKMAFDDNALFRHPDLARMRDPHEESELEARARQAGLNYVGLDGDIGCVVNGAGLAMATMDLIKLHGGMPANFMDVGGGVSAEQAVEAFRIVLADPKVKAVLVDIFGGIARCDVIAEALIQAGRQRGLNVPVVVRLEGTRAEEARRLLAQAAGELPRLTGADDLTDAARKAVAAAAAGQAGVAS